MFVGWKQVLAGFNTFLVNLERFPPAKTVADWPIPCHNDAGLMESVRDSPFSASHCQGENRHGRDAA